MQNLNLFELYTEKLDENDIEYFITGSVASIVYGEPRLTHDIDIVISLAEKDAYKISRAFSSDEFYIPPIEVIKNEVLRTSRGHFNIIHFDSGFKADIYLTGNDEFQIWALENKKVIEFLGKKMAIAPPEYVIIKKLEFFKEGKSEKHINDIKNIIANSSDILNFMELDTFAEKHGVFKEWREIHHS